MADITITPANVTPGADAVMNRGIAAVQIDAGESVYIDSTGKIALADADAAASSVPAGVALNTAHPGQPIEYAVSGSVGYGAGVFAPGRIYLVSVNAGQIRPSSDLDAAQYAGTLGIALDDETLKLNLFGPAVVTT